ncbi:MAG: hypothetical protein PHW02_04990, partial [bacterium]|nr:hypothetical protein [bacterium]
MDKRYLESSFKVNSFEEIAPYYMELSERVIDSKEDLENLINDYGRLTEAFQEDYGWAYINMTRDTANAEYRERFSLFNDKIGPEVEKISFLINKKIADSSFAKEIKDSKWDLFLKRLEVSVRIFRDENVKIKTDVANLSVDYQEKVGSVMIEFQGKEYTQSQMAQFFESKDRSIRREAFEKVAAKRLALKESIDAIFLKMVAQRHQMALNAGFKSYTEYRFKELERFDYTPKECAEFHDAVLEVCTPLLREIIAGKTKKLQLDKMMPYDAHATLPEDEVLKPFADAQDFVEKSRQVFASIDARFLNVFEKVNSE